MLFSRLLPRILLLQYLIFGSALQAATPSHSVRPTQVYFGQAASLPVQLDDTKTHIAMQPAGPYATHVIKLASRPLHLALLNTRLFVATANSQVLEINFDNNTPETHTRLQFEQTIKNIAATDEHLLVASGNKIYTYLFQGRNETIPAGEFQSTHEIDVLSAHKQHVCVLLDNNTIEFINLEKPGKLLGAYHATQNVNSISASDTQCYISGDEFGLAVIDFSTASKPKIISRFRSPGTAKSVFIENDTAYLADGPGGFAIFDLSGDDSIRWLGSHNKLGHIDDIRVQSGMALVNNNEQRIASIDTGNPVLPITDSFYKPRDKIQHMISQWPIAYIATNIGIERVDFSQTANIQISNEGVNQGGSRRAFIHDNIAYVADWFSGLHLYDITLPQHPRHISNYHTPGSSKGVVVKEGYAFVGDDDHGLQVIDVSNPLQPTWVSQVLSTGLAYTMKMVGNIIYLADHRGGFHIIDVSEVKSPQILGSFDTPGKSWAIDVAGDIAYVADDTSGLLIFDVHDPKNIRQIGQFNPGGYAEDVKVIAEHAYVAFFDKGFYILDVSDPAHPALLGHTPIPGNARSINVDGPYAYIAGWESGLQIVDIRKPDSPAIASYVDTDGSAWGLDLHRNHAYVWDWWGGVKVIDIEQPLKPRSVARYHANSIIEKLHIHGNFIYTANGSNGVQVYDINNPLNPIWATGLDLGGNVKDIFIDGDYAYIAAGNGGIHVADVSDPFYINWISQLPTTGEIDRILAHGTTLLAKNSHGNLLIIDARNPENLVARERLSINIRDFMLQDKLLFTTDEQGLSIYQIDDGVIELQRSFPITSNLQLVRSNGEYIYAYEKDQGVHILKLENDKLDPIAKFNLPAAISDIQVSKESMYLSSNSLGLLVIDITNSKQPALTTRYPATGTMGSFIVNNQAAFFAGDKTITSVALLPNIKNKKLGATEAVFELPATMPMGQFHLMTMDSAGQWQVTPGLFTVKSKKSGKAKFTMDDFKKIMEQKKHQITP